MMAGIYEWGQLDAVLFDTELGLIELQGTLVSGILVWFQWFLRTFDDIVFLLPSVFNTTL